MTMPDEERVRTIVARSRNKTKKIILPHQISGIWCRIFNEFS